MIAARNAPKYTAPLIERVGIPAAVTAAHAAFFGMIYYFAGEEPPKKPKQPAKVIIEFRDRCPLVSEPETYVPEIISEAQKTFQLYGVGGVQELAAQTIAQGNLQLFASADCVDETDDCTSGGDEHSIRSPTSTYALPAMGSQSATATNEPSVDWNAYVQSHGEKSIKTVQEYEYYHRLGLVQQFEAEKKASGFTCESTQKGIFLTAKNDTTTFQVGMSSGGSSGDDLVDLLIARNEQVFNEIMQVNTNPNIQRYVTSQIHGFTETTKKMIYGDFVDRLDALLCLDDFNIDGITYGGDLIAAKEALYKEYCHTNGSICLPALRNAFPAREALMKYGGLSDTNKEFLQDNPVCYLNEPQCTKRWKNLRLYSVKFKAVQKSVFNKACREMLVAFAQGDMHRVSALRDEYYKKVKEHYDKNGLHVLHAELQKAYDEMVLKATSDEHGLLHFGLPEECRDSAYTALSADKRTRLARKKSDLAHYNAMLKERQCAKGRLHEAWNIPVETLPAVHQALYAVIDVHDPKERIDVMHTLVAQQESNVSNQVAIIDALFLPNGILKDFAHYERAKSLDMHRCIMHHIEGSTRHLLNHLVYAESVCADDLKGECAHAIECVQRALNVRNNQGKKEYLIYAYNILKKVQGETHNALSDAVNAMLDVNDGATRAVPLSDNGAMGLSGDGALLHKSTNEAVSATRNTRGNIVLSEDSFKSEEHTLDFINEHQLRCVMRAMNFMEQSNIDAQEFYDFYGTDEQNDLHERMGDFLITNVDDLVVPDNTTIKPLHFAPQLLFQEGYATSFKLNKAGLLTEAELLFEVSQELSSIQYFGQCFAKRVTKSVMQAWDNPGEAAFALLSRGARAIAIGAIIAGVVTLAGAASPVACVVGSTAMGAQSIMQHCLTLQEEWNVYATKLKEDLKQFDGIDTTPLQQKYIDIKWRKGALEFTAELAALGLFAAAEEWSTGFAVSKMSPFAMQYSKVQSLVQGSAKFKNYAFQTIKKKSLPLKEGVDRCKAWMNSKFAKHQQPACAGVPGGMVDASDKKNGLATMNESSQQSAGGKWSNFSFKVPPTKIFGSGFRSMKEHAGSLKSNLIKSDHRIDSRAKDHMFHEDHQLNLLVGTTSLNADHKNELFDKFRYIINIADNEKALKFGDNQIETVIANKLATIRAHIGKNGDLLSMNAFEGKTTRQCDNMITIISEFL